MMRYSSIRCENWFGYHLIGMCTALLICTLCLVHIVKNLNEADQKQWIEKASNGICLGNSNVFYSALWNKANEPQTPITHSHYTAINTPYNSNTAVTWTPHEYHSEISVNIQDLTTNIRKISTCTVRLQAPKMIKVMPVTKQSANLNFNILYSLKKKRREKPQSSKEPTALIQGWGHQIQIEE